MSNQLPTFNISNWFPEIPPDQIKLMKVHFNLILQHNKSLNLISNKSLPFTDILFYADSILGSRIVKKSAPITEIFDLGSGAGFPGVVFAILFQDTRVTLVESDKKRADFLNIVQAQLGLKNLFVLTEKVENLKENSINHAISRDFGSLTNNLIVSRRLFPKGGQYFHMKGESWGLELSQIPVQVCSYWSPSLLGEYKLPLGDFKLSVIRTEKTQD